MTEDYSAIKKRLREYLNKRGIAITNKKPPTLKCPNRGHGGDENPTAVLYENQDTPAVHCPKCNYTASIFEVCGMIDGIPDTKESFPEKLKSVKATLGLETMPVIENKPLNKKPKTAPVSLPLEEARKIYNTEFILKKGIELKYGTEIKGSWKYTDKDNNIIALDVRFEGADVKKSVITFWYDGKNLRWSNPPILIYNLYEAMQSDKPLLIVEGGKCCDIAKQLEYFTSLSWSGGSGKAHLIEWKIFENRECFMFPDDDNPGIKAANIIKEQLPHLKIVKPLEQARQIKSEGADIEEALQIMSPDELTAYILNPENILNVSIDEPANINSPVDMSVGTPPPADAGLSMQPFKILGIGDDGRANFITEAGRLESYTLESLSKNKLLVLASRFFWRTDYQNRDGKTSWDDAIDDIIRISQNKDFDSNQIRGRGAWMDGDKISYHDGVTTHGEYDKKKIYLRLPLKDIGIMDTPIEIETIKKIKSIIFKMSFETPADAVRCLAWSTLAPFAGCLKYRPAMLLTGASGTGKSTVATLIVKKISNCIWLNGSESTVAGVRGKVQKDSCAVVFEETEKDTEKKRVNRDELFSLMRVNVTDDAPDTVKGTKDGGFNSFKMQNMFGFIAIDPTVDSIADENRIFRINMVKPENGNDWKSIEVELRNLLDEKNARAIRALTWNKLKVISALTERIVDLIRRMTGRDYRSSYSDAMLAACFMVIWTGTDEPTEDQIIEMLYKYYEYQPADEHRDEAKEIIDRLLDEIIEIIHEGNQREKLSIIEALKRIYTEKKEGDGVTDDIVTTKELLSYKQHLARLGIRVYEKNKIAIASNHHMIKKIIGMSEGYTKILKRYKGYAGSRVISYSGESSKQSVIFKGILDGELLNDL